MFNRRGFVAPIAFAAAALFAAACKDSPTVATPVAKIAAPKSGISKTVAPTENCTQASDCSLTTPVPVATLGDNNTVIVTWAAVANADHYTTNCDVAAGDGASCSGGGNVVDPGNVATLSTVFTTSGNGMYHFSVKAHGHGHVAHAPANGQNSLDGWATDGTNTNIDICVGNCGAPPTGPPSNPPPTHVHVSVSCPTSVVYNATVQAPCTADVTGDNSLSLSLPVTYTGDQTNVGTVTASASYPGDDTHLPGDASTTFDITPAPVTITAANYSGSYDGASHDVSACVVSANYDNLTCSDSPASAGPDVGGGAVTPSQSGNGWSNYSSTATAGAWAITPALVTAKAGSASGLYTGFAYTASACVVSGTYTGDLACTNNPASLGPNVGSAVTAPVVTGSNLALDYTITNVNGSINIGQAPMTVTAFTGARTYGQSNPTACAVAGAVNGEIFTCTSSAGANATSPVSPPTWITTGTLNPSASAVSNYSVTYFTGTLTIVAYNLSAGCYMQPLYSAMPSTKSYQNKGSVLPIKCTILNNTGGAVANASGDLTITDVTANVSIHVAANAFKYTGGGLYMNQQDTSAPFYQLKHYYTVSSTFDDGVSHVTGYFYIASK